MGLDKIKKTPCGFCFVEYLFWFPAAASPMCVVSTSSSSQHSELSRTAVENLKRSDSQVLSTRHPPVKPCYFPATARTGRQTVQQCCR